MSKRNSHIRDLLLEAQLDKAPHPPFFKDNILARLDKKEKKKIGFRFYLTIAFTMCSLLIVFALFLKHSGSLQNIDQQLAWRLNMNKDFIKSQRIKRYYAGLETKEKNSGSTKEVSDKVETAKISNLANMNGEKSKKDIITEIRAKIVEAKDRAIKSIKVSDGSNIKKDFNVEKKKNAKKEDEDVGRDENRENENGTKYLYFSTDQDAASEALGENQNGDKDQEEGAPELYSIAGVVAPKSSCRTDDCVSGIAGAAIKLINQEDATYSYEVESDQNGSFMVNIEKSGKYTVIANANNYLVYKKEGEEFFKSIDGYQIILGAMPGSIHGKVTDSSTNLPLATEVCFTKLNSSEDMVCGSSNNVSGLYSKGLSLNSKYQIEVSLAGYYDYIADIEVLGSIDKNIELIPQLPERYSFSGKVLNMIDPTFANHRVGLYCSEEACGETLQRNTFTDSRGEFEFNNLLNGGYVITVFKDWDRIYQFPIKITQNVSDYEIVIDFNRPGHIASNVNFTVTFKNSSGGAINGVSVILKRQNTQYANPWILSNTNTTTKSVKADHYQITVFHKEYDTLVKDLTIGRDLNYEYVLSKDTLISRDYQILVFSQNSSIPNDVVQVSAFYTPKGFDPNKIIRPYYYLYVNGAWTTRLPLNPTSEIISIYSNYQNKFHRTFTISRPAGEMISFKGKYNGQFCTVNGVPLKNSVPHIGTFLPGISSPTRIILTCD